MTKKSRMGDESAFERLYVIMKQSIHYFLLRFTSDTTNFEDIIQDTFLSILNKEKEFEYNDCLSYILTTSKYILFNKNKKCKNIKFDSELIDLSTISYDSDKMNLNYLFSQLDSATKSLIYCFFYTDLKLNKIAKLYDTSLATLKRRKKEVIKHMKEKF